MTRMRERKLILAQSGYISAAVAAGCEELRGDSFFASGAAFPGTHRRVASTLSELREWGLDADDMVFAAGKLTGDTANKLESLAFVEGCVSDSLRSIARERNSDRIARTMEMESAGTELGRLVVVVSSEITWSQAQWLIWALAQGLELTLILENVFHRELPALNHLLQELKAKPSFSGVPNVLQASLFSREVASDEMSTQIKVEIVSAADPLAECEWVLRSIAKKLEEGHGPGDLCIYCRNQEAYVPLLESAAARFSLPVSCPRRMPLMANSYVRLTLDLLEFCAGDDVRAMLKVLKSTYLSLGREMRDLMESAVKDSFATGEYQWKALEQWCDSKGTEAEWLSRLLAWRAENMGSPALLTEWSERLRKFGEQPWQDEAVSGFAGTSLRDEYAQSAIQRSLAQYASIELVRKRNRFNLRDFVRTCRKVWESGEVSCPSDISAVQIVSSSDSVWDVRTLYVLGLLEGVFPRRRQEDPILTDDDRLAINAVFPDRVPLATSHDKALLERDEFSRLCGAASESLIFSYPQTDDERDNVRAFYLVEVERALAGAVVLTNHARTKLTSRTPSLSADLRLAEALDGPRSPGLPNELFSFEARKAVSEAARRFLTVADLAEVLECPFRYLVQRNLRLAPNRKRSRWHRLFRLPRDTGLASLPFKESAELALKLALETEVAKLVADGTPHDLALMKSGGERLIDEWLEREFSARELWPRDTIVDKPSFERGDLRGKLKAGKQYVQLEGDFPALSERNGYRVLHIFTASNPFEDNSDGREEMWFKLRERIQFEYGLYLSALLSSSSDRVGIEVDRASGGRLLFLTPRPDEGFRADQARQFMLVGIDHELRGEIKRNVGESVLKATGRIHQAVVEPSPGKECRTCDFGELCRRSSEYSEEGDPFDTA